MGEKYQTNKQTNFPKYFSSMRIYSDLSGPWLRKNKFEFGPKTWQVQEKRSKRDFSVAASNIANTKKLHYSLLKLMENYFFQPFEKLKSKLSKLL